MTFQWTRSSTVQQEPREVECKPFSHTYVVVTSLVVLGFVSAFDYVLLTHQWPFLGWWTGQSSRGLSSEDWFLLLFMAPFNLIAILIPFGPLFSWIEKRRPVPFDYEIDRFQPREIIRLGPGPIGSFAASFFFACFVGAFFAGIANVLRLPMVAFWCIAALEVIGAIIGGIVLRVRTKNGRYDLILNNAKGTVSLPSTASRKERVEVPYRDIARFRVRHFRKTDGHGESSYYTHLIVERKNDEPIIVEENFWLSKGERLADWLNQKLRLPASDANTNLA